MSRRRTILLFLGLILTVAGTSELARRKFERPTPVESTPASVSTQPQSRVPDPDPLRQPAQAAPQRGEPKPTGHWAKAAETETQYLRRETWNLEVSGLRVYPIRERVTTRSKDSGAVVSQTGETEQGAAPSRPIGAFRLSEAQAKQQARSAWEQWGELRGPARAQEFEKIVWAEDRTPGALSRLAYRVVEQGRETIVDADSGAILMRADRRVRN